MAMPHDTSHSSTLEPLEALEPLAMPTAGPDTTEGPKAATGLRYAPTDSIRLDDYDYPLPRHLVAKYPLEQRDQSRMMVIQPDLEGSQGQEESGDSKISASHIGHHHFYDLPDLLAPGDLVIINNAKVISARFHGNRQGHTGHVEVLLLYPTPQDPMVWSCLMKPARKCPPGTMIELPGTGAHFQVEERYDQGRGVVSIHPGPHGSLEALMEAAGEMPLPPYMERTAEASDATTYQTVFAKPLCAQAAPTAGLHFTPEIFQRLETKGIEVAEITLAVGIGTFRPVTADTITDHQMDPEYYELPQATVDAIGRCKARGGRIVAIGTTVTKTLETVAHKQGGGISQADSGWSDLFIYPGFSFQVVNSLLTNFHLPKSTLMMLVSAFYNREHILAAYHQAIEHQYRFYSYGDCMLIHAPASNQAI